ncbi:ABC transporter substrate-binding protein [Pseudofrankia asymbiotica]|uniref:ABC transporter substrate-binding protein n=1 Tax=Pseudofrankia asymbiotica TaxID=1834516 RepID=UPI001303F675|nr:ABC transporter substrate-binding protein [Pseudofrankia asymbiotica]
MALTLAAGGCSVGNGSARPTGCSSPGVSQDEIKVGLIYPDTGEQAVTVSAARSGVQARISAANEAGGIHGRQVKLDWRDDTSTTNGNLIAAKDLVERAGDFGIIEQSAVSAGSADYLTDKGVPVTGSALEPVWKDHENMFSGSYNDGQGATTAFGLYAQHMGGTKAFVISTPVAAAKGIATKLTASLKSQGIPVVGSMEFFDATTSPARVAAEFAAADADVLVGATSGEAFASVVAALRSSHTALKVAFSPVGYDGALLQKYGAGVAGMSVYMSFTPFETQTQGIRRFDDAMTRFAPELRRPDQTFAMNGYIAADLFLRGLELAGTCPTREGFIDSLKKSSYDADGLLPSPVKLGSIPRTVDDCSFFVRVNSAGTAFDPVPSDSKTKLQWCGEHISE